MKVPISKNATGKSIIGLISLVSLLSIASGLFLDGGTIFLPLVFQQEPDPTPTATTPPVTTTEPTPPGTPLPPPSIKLIVTPKDPEKEWALAWFAKSYNQAGRPVMQIYPGDSSPQSERIKIPEGEIVLALESPVIADGGIKFWQLVDYKGKNGETLYLKAEDVTKAPN